MRKKTQFDNCLIGRAVGGKLFLLSAHDGLFQFLSGEEDFQEEIWADRNTADTPQEVGVYNCTLEVWSEGRYHPVNGDDTIYGLKIANARRAAIVTNGRFCRAQHKWIDLDHVEHLGAEETPGDWHAVAYCRGEAVILRRGCASKEAAEQWIMEFLASYGEIRERVGEALREGGER